MKTKTFVEFFQDRCKNSNYPVITLPITLIRWIGIENILDEDIKQYKKYLHRVEELQTTAKYAL